VRSQPFLSPFVSAPQATLTGDLVAMSSPAGHAKGIVIDNPSGSWLLVFPTYDYVPPYVLGWSRDFPYEVASTTVRYVNGPSGQISTQQGDPFDVVLDTDVVEVPCLVDGNGVQPTRVGALPPQLAALISTNVNVQELTVEAALTGRRDHVYHAAMLDPHTAAELDLDQIWALVDDLLDAHAGWVPPLG
jgi:hypothetical protein